MTNISACSQNRIDTLLKNGVIIPDPAAVFIAPEVAPEKIAPGAVIHPFCRIAGAKTSIGPNCVLGSAAPATIDNCQLGAQVKLAGGYFSGATFLDNSSMGSCAQVRPGTLIEEFASGAHAVGLKQTVLFPYVVLGSLINFCDCLMAGGTSRKNHSEVGSSYIHFNYTPHQDKATPSLIGNVSKGVLLDQPPVFLGGQGGLVGPARVAFGVVAPAGMIIRKDVMTSGLVGNPEQQYTNKNSREVGQGLWPSRPTMCGSPRGFAPPVGAEKVATFIPGAYRSIDRIIKNNLIYIGNIYALKAWYRRVRAKFMTEDKFQSACLHGALERLESILQERINRLDELAEKMPRSMELNMQMHGAQAESYLGQQKIFADSWPKMRAALTQFDNYEGDPAERDALLAGLDKQSAQGYLEAIVSLSGKDKAAASSWLQSIVDRVSGIWETDGRKESGAGSQ